jgi:hypothetical protein
MYGKFNWHQRYYGLELLEMTSKIRFDQSLPLPKLSEPPYKDPLCVFGTSSLYSFRYLDDVRG